MGTEVVTGKQDEPSSSESLGDPRTELAYGRSAEAAERTLMAAVRTAVAMISFGFTIAKFFEYLATLGVAESRAELGREPHHLGLILLVGGTVVLVTGMIEYLSTLRRLRRQAAMSLHLTTALVTAAVVLGVGLFAAIVLLVDLASM